MAVGISSALIDGRASGAMTQSPEYIILEPREGRPAFELSEIRAYLATWPQCVQDPVDDHSILVVDGDGARAAVVRQRRERPEEPFTGGLVRLGSDRLELGLAWANRRELPVLRDVAQWLVDHLSPRIMSEVAGDDWTDRCGGRVEPMFPEFLRAERSAKR